MKRDQPESPNDNNNNDEGTSSSSSSIISSDKKAKTTPEHFDVVIVGSGLSGLSTSYYLHKASPSKIKTLVLEASNYFGGRTRTINIDVPKDDGSGDTEPVPASIGGTWAVLESWATERLNKDVGASKLLYKPKMTINHVTEKLAYGPLLLARLYFLGRKIVKAGKDGKWWDSKVARKHDKETLQKWMKRKLLSTSIGREGVREYFMTVESFQEDVRMSCTYAAVMLYERLSPTIKGIFKLQLPHAKRWHKGTGVFVDAIIKATQDLSPHTSKFQTNSRVTTIDQSGENVVISFTHGIGDSVETDTVTANRVVVSSAIDAAFLEINYIPPLPSKAIDLAKSIDATDFPSLNTVLIWRNDWWTKDGKSMNILPDMLAKTDEEVQEVFRFGQAFDLTDHHPKYGTGDYGIIRILSNPVAAKGLSESQTVDKAKEYLKEYFDDKYHDFIDNGIIASKVYYWTSYRPQLPGVTFQFKKNAVTEGGDYMRDPIGKVHLGGAERANGGLNWMEGAIQRGMEVWQELENEGIYTEVKDTDQIPIIKSHLSTCLDACMRKCDPPSDLLTSEEVDDDDDKSDDHDLIDFDFSKELAEHVSNVSEDIMDAAEKSTLEVVHTFEEAKNAVGALEDRISDSIQAIPKITKILGWIG